MVYPFVLNPLFDLVISKTWFKLKLQLRITSNTINTVFSIVNLFKKVKESTVD